MARYLLDPSATLDFKKDWSQWLASGETITAASVTVTPTETTTGTVTTPTVVIQSQSHDTTSVTVWLTDGDAGQTVTVTYHVTTSAGREDDRSDTVTIRER